MIFFCRNKTSCPAADVVSHFRDLTRGVLGHSIAGFLSQSAGLPNNTFDVGKVKVDAVEKGTDGQVHSFSLVMPLLKKRGLLGSLLHLSRYKKIGSLTVRRDMDRKLCSAYLASAHMFGLRPAPALDWTLTPDCTTVRVPTDTLPSERDVLTHVAEKQRHELAVKLLEVKSYCCTISRHENIKRAVLAL